MTCIDSTITGEHLAADLVLPDLRVPPTGTDQALVAFAQPPARASVGFVVLGQHPGPSSGFDVDALMSVIKEMTQVDRFEPPAGAAYRRRGSDLDRLTPRERETLAEMALGKNNAAVAKSLFLSRRAVEKHISSIVSKLGLTEEANVNRRVKAVLLHLEASRDAAAA